MKIMTIKLALLRWVMALAVAVMVSGCILPPPWMRELDPWALTNMTPDERPAEEIDWIEFEVEVSEHVKRVVVRGVTHANAKRSCNAWALGKGGSLYLGEGSVRHIRSEMDINLSKTNADFYAGKIQMPRNKYLPGYCDWRPTAGMLSVSFYLVDKDEPRKENEWGGGAFAPVLILADDCNNGKWYSGDNIHGCLTDIENELVFPNVDRHCSKDLYVGGGSDIYPLYPRSTSPVIINGVYSNKGYRLKLLVTPTAKKVKFIYNCNEE